MNKIIFEEIVTVTKEDYFFEEFGKVKSEGNERVVELNGHSLYMLSSWTDPVLRAAKKGDKLRQLTLDDPKYKYALQTKFVPLN
jgi:hypothetical protein